MGWSVRVLRAKCRAMVGTTSACSDRLVTGGALTSLVRARQSGICRLTVYRSDWSRFFVVIKIPRVGQVRLVASIFAI